MSRAAGVVPGLCRNTYELPLGRLGPPVSEHMFDGAPSATGPN